MKVALCLFGFSYGTYSNRNVNFFKGYESYQKNLLEKYDIDVFIHSWNDNRDNLIKYYQPKELLLEDQAEFKQKFENTDDFHNFKYGLKDVKYYSARVKYKDYSQFYSINQVNQLRLKYQETHKITYDLIILSRFDMDLKVNRDLSTYDPTKFYVNDKRKCRYRNEIKKFKYIIAKLYMGNNEDINYMSNLFHHLHKYKFARPAGSKHSIHHVVSHYLYDHPEDLIKRTRLLNWKEFSCEVLANRIITEPQKETKEATKEETTKEEITKEEITKEAATIKEKKQ